MHSFLCRALIPRASGCLSPEVPIGRTIHVRAMMYVVDDQIYSVAVLGRGHGVGRSGMVNESNAKQIPVFACTRLYPYA
jgi:hypothetical protein